ncbi:hypothetical protein [Microbacterium aurum]
MQSPPFDARPLIEPVDRATARAYAQELRRTGRAPAGMGAAGIVIAIVVGVVFLFMFGSVFVGILSTMISMMSSGPNGFGVFAVVPIVFLVLIVGGIGFAIWRMARGSGAERWYRLDRFARANGMSWHPVADNPPLPGMVFGHGSSRRATDVVRGDRPRFVEFGNYQYTTGSGKNRTTLHWGYVAVKLSTPLPHIVLDATSNNALFGSNLPAWFDRAQRLSLEGDFDKYFALYCPQGYEADALYLFTPDIMARFIDHAAALDVEIVDDWMFLYAKRQFSTLDPATWSWLFSVVGAFLDKFAQWERWRDDRLAASTAALAAMPAPTPAPEGGTRSGGRDAAPVRRPDGAAAPAAGSRGRGPAPQAGSPVAGDHRDRGVRGDVAADADGGVRSDPQRSARPLTPSPATTT